MSTIFFGREVFYWPSKRSKFVALVGFRTLPGEGIIFDPQVSQAPLMMARLLLGAVPFLR